MKQATGLFSIFVTGLMLAGVLAGLAVNSHDGNRCRYIPVNIGPGNMDSRDASPSASPAPVYQPTPTLAPPRLEHSPRIGPSAHEMANGQPVFLQVETDQSEIEVSWAAP
ncbi:MAG: hypothetical protein IT426_04750 [Pirellulales bacterium]|nr:hypothetical protein [Pirellulales bacterium]